MRMYGTLGAGVRDRNYRSSAQAEGQCGLMAKKVTVTLVDDFDGEGAADETVEFGRMCGIRAFVSEHAIQLEDPVETAHQATL